MKIHKKIWPAYFNEVLSGQKTFEYRLADFECKPGEILVLDEWDPKTKDYTGRSIEREVGYVLPLNNLEFTNSKEDIEKYGFQVISLKKKQYETIKTIILAAGNIIEKDGKFLLVQERKAKAYGLWNIPAGRVEEGYTIVETAVKEAKEETGFDVEVISQIGIFHKEGEAAAKHIFKSKIIGGELTVPEDEMLDVRWFTKDEINELHKENKLRADYFVDLINNYAD